MYTYLSLSIYIYIIHMYIYICIYNALELRHRSMGSARTSGAMGTRSSSARMALRISLHVQRYDMHIYMREQHICERTTI